MNAVLVMMTNGSGAGEGGKEDVTNKAAKGKRSNCAVRGKTEGEGELRLFL